MLKNIAVAALSIAIGLAASQLAADTIGLNFTGTTRSFSDVFVPDVMGAVGPDHIVEALNLSIAVYEKATGRLLRRQDADSFWRATLLRGGGGSVDGTFDPRIVYDPTSSRWFATYGDASRTPNSKILLGISDTDSPIATASNSLNNAWKSYQLDGDPSAQPNTRDSDFPTLGVNRDSLTISTALRDIPGGNVEPRGIAVYSIPKSDLLQSTPTVANRGEFTFAKPAALGSSITALQGVLDFGPADGRAALFAVNPALGLQRWDLLNTAESRAGAAALSSPISIPIDSFQVPPSADQPGSVQNLYNDGPFRGVDGTVVADLLKFGSNLVQQGNHAWGVHVAKAGDRSGLRWYEIDLETNQLAQSGTISDPALDLTYPSIAVNQFGDAVIGFTATGENLFPSAYAVVGDTVDGVTTFGGLMELKRGVSTYVDLAGSDRNRWGDYSQTVLDPSDPLHFWTFQEFTVARDQWAVQITQIITEPAASSWNTDADGNWSVASNWNSGVPNAADAAAILGSAIRQARTVTVDTPITLGHIKFDSTNSYTIAGASALAFDRALGDAQINVANGSHTISAPVTLAKSTLINVSPTSNLSITGALDASAVSLTKAGNGTLTVNNIRAAALTINAGTVAIAPNGTDAATSRVGALSFALVSGFTGKLDLSNNAAIVDYSETSPTTPFRQLIIAGRGGPGFGKGWNSHGITSSAAAAANAAEPESRSVGYAENSAIPSGPYTTFHGQPVDSTSILIAYTRTGDANLDGVVNDDDVTIISATYAPGMPQPSWALGDFDYNGFVDDDDVTLLGAFYDPSAPPLISPVAIGGSSSPVAPGAGVSAGAQSISAIPEPSTLVLGVVAFVGVSWSFVVRARRTSRADNQISRRALVLGFIGQPDATAGRLVCCKTGR